MPRHLLAQPHRAERSILVLTCVDGALRTAPGESVASARSALHELSHSGIPIVLASHHHRDEMMALENELGVQEPFIAENGRTLAVPRGYFARLPGLTTTGSWDVIEFEPPSIEDAIEMLMWLFRVSGESPLLVGVGASWNDHLLLRHVDIPVLVKNQDIDQRRLLAQFPDAYITQSTGIDGWTEAILGVTG